MNRGIVRIAAAVGCVVLLAGCLGGAPGAGDDDPTGQTTADGVTWRARTGASRQAYLVEELDRFNAGLDPTARRAKYDRMRASPFGFFRGTAHVFYRDLRTGRDAVRASPSWAADAVTWVQGDAHAMNFGSFDNDQGRVVYDLNDFDESWVASYLFDLWRLGASVALVAAENRGFTDEQVRAVLEAYAGSYLDTLESYRGNDTERHAAVTSANAYGLLDEFLTDTEHHDDRRAMLDDWTVNRSGTRRFRTDSPDLAAATADERTAITAAMAGYRDALTSGLRSNAEYFRVLDVARRLDAGTGSLGADRFYVLVAGASAGADDDRILDVKRQGDPAYLDNLTDAERRAYRARFSAGRQGCRVALAQRAMGTDVDDHLGCLNALGASFSVRERSPYKETFDTRQLNSIARLQHVAEQWGSILATAHARADRDFDPTLVPGNLEDRVHALTSGRHAQFIAEARQFAAGYAAQAVTDHRLFVDALARGLLR